MSLSFSFRWYRFKARIFFWVYYKVRDLYFRLDTHFFKKYRLSPEVFSKDTLKLAHTVAEMSCKSSGTCAIKEWKPSDTVSQKTQELAWRARQETKEADLAAYNDMMEKIQSIREITPEERAAAQKAIEAINQYDGSFNG